MRDAETQIHEGTDQVQRMVIARSLVRLPARRPAVTRADGCDGRVRSCGVGSSSAR